MIQSACRALGIALVALYCFLPATTASAFDDKDVINQARSAYYGSQDQGSIEFQCTVTPNWAGLLQEQRKENPSNIDDAIIKLKKLHFFVSVANNGSTKITHNTIAADNSKMAEGLTQVYEGIGQMISGFFQTWSLFMKYSPFPAPDGKYQLQEQGGRWNLTYRDGTADVVTTMNKDFSVRELKTTSPEFISTIQPQFVRSNVGFLLTGYKADYRGKLPNAQDITHLEIRISYQKVNELQVPLKLNLVSTYNGVTSKVEVAFSACKETKH